jgi:hypothetical protein
MVCFFSCIRILTDTKDSQAVRGDLLTRSSLARNIPSEMQPQHAWNVQSAFARVAGVAGAGPGTRNPIAEIRWLGHAICLCGPEMHELLFLSGLWRANCRCSIVFRRFLSGRTYRQAVNNPTQIDRTPYDISRPVWLRELACVIVALLFPADCEVFSESGQNIQEVQKNFTCDSLLR